MLLTSSFDNIFSTPTGLRWIHIDCRVLRREECFDKPWSKRFRSDRQRKIANRGHMPRSCLLCWHPSISSTWCSRFGIKTYSNSLNTTRTHTHTITTRVSEGTNKINTYDLLIWQTNGPSWSVPTGRRDGRISLSSQASNLPSPLEPVSVHRQKFAAKGLDDHDLVTLLGKLFDTNPTFCRHIIHVPSIWFIRIT